MASTRAIRVKNNTNESFDGEISEKIAARGKLFRKLKKIEVKCGRDTI